MRARRRPPPRRTATQGHRRARAQAAGAPIPPSPALEDFKAGFKEATAAAADVPPSLVKIKAVKKGSIVVDFEIEVRPARPARLELAAPRPRWLVGRCRRRWRRRLIRR